MARSITDHYARQRQMITDQLTARRQRLSEHLRAVQAGDVGSIETEAQSLQRQADRLAKEVTDASKNVDDLRKQTDLIGTSSIDVEMMRAEIGELQKTFSAIADEREHARLDLNAPGRITLIQPAMPPTAPDKSSRLQNAITAGLFGFVRPGRLAACGGTCGPGGSTRCRTSLAAWGCA